MFHKVAFIIRLTEWVLHIKKEVNYKHRCEQKMALFRDQIKGLAPEQIVYIDETGVDNNLFKLRCWALKGFKSFAEALGFRTKRVTLISCYCYGAKKLVAPMEYDNYTNSELFLTWVELSSARVKELIESAGCKLIYLPPYHQI